MLLNQLGLRVFHYKQQEYITPVFQYPLLSKVSWYPKNLIANILNKQELSNLINKYSVTQYEIYEDIVDDIKKYLTKYIPIEMYQYLKKLSQEIKPKV